MNGWRFAGEPFPELTRLQQQLDDLFQTRSPSNIRPTSRGAFPAVNVGSSPDSIEVLAFAPGVDPKALQITVDRGVLVISGERASESAARGEADTFYAQERFTGAFRRVVSLPEDADPQKVEASLNNGVLHISVAKREASKPRRIEIN